jgi:EAL domain-containing protein (putative c-di-GMP-specific phosphodiesterase class I)
MSDPGRAITALNRLSTMGVNISIDDFGTGYSSLAYLKKMPVSLMKIDRSFVMHMCDDPNDVAIVGSTVELAHSLGLRAIGEGVESEDALGMLKELCCDFAQGFHIGRPMPIDELMALLDDRGDRRRDHIRIVS